MRNGTAYYPSSPSKDTISIRAMKTDDQGNIRLEDVLRQRPAEIHKGSTSVSSGDVNIEDMIEKSGCSSTYYALEECLGENDRKWQACQAEVRALKKCNQEQGK